MSAKKDEKKPEDAAHAAPAGGEAAPAKNSKMGLILVGGFITAVIAIETIVFFLMVPSGEEVAALAETRLIHQAEVQHLLNSHEDDNGERVVEFELGAFPVSFVPPGSDRQYRVEFRLFGTLQSKDVEKLKKLFTEREGRFRHRLMLEIRNSSIDELQENQLGLLQRRILATSTEVFEEAILLSVGFHDYQVMED